MSADIDSSLVGRTHKNAAARISLPAPSAEQCVSETGENPAVQMQVGALETPFDRDNDYLDLEWNLKSMTNAGCAVSDGDDVQYVSSNIDKFISLRSRIIPASSTGTLWPTSGSP